MANFLEGKIPKIEKKSSYAGELELDENIARAKGLRYKSWATIISHWYGDPGVSRPHIEFIREPKKTYQELVRLIANPTTENIEKINTLYREKIAECTNSIRKIFQEPDAQIIFETNGTNALSFIRALAGAEGETVLKTNDMGKLTGDALSGEDTSLMKGDFKQPLGLFSPSEKLEKLTTSDRFETNLYEGNRQKSIDEIYSEMCEAIKKYQPKLVVVPQVSRTGMELPVEKIGKYIKDLNSQMSSGIFFAVDGAQSVGRSGEGKLKKPLDYCDAYFFVGQKALGAMTSAVIIAKPELVEKNASKIVDSSVASRLCHYKFSDTPPEIKKFLQSKEEQFAMSLPEIESLGIALDALYLRGKGETFAERREGQIWETKEKRAFIVDELSKLKGIKFIGEENESTSSPHIVTFMLTDEAAIDSENLRLKLLRLNPPITLAPMYQEPFLRIGLSELRKQDLSYLTNSIKKILGEAEENSKG